VNPGESPDPDVAAVTVRAIDDVTVVSVSGAVDAITAPTIRGDIESVVAGDLQALVIDLSDVDFLGSEGLDILITTRAAAAEDVPIVVVADGRVTRRPIELTGVDEFVPVHSTLDAALDAVRK
jgi:anti-anti-sigma factor